MRREYAGRGSDNDPATAYFSDDLERFKTISFASRSEYALAVLGERYIPGWECRPGDTCHIKVGTKEIDFKFFGLWVEFHPTTRWDWGSSEASALYREHFRGLSVNEKRASWLSIKKEFAYRYYRERRQVLDLTGHENEPLVVCEDAQDVYHKVIRRFGRDYPGQHEFVRMWEGLIASCGPGKH